MKSTDPLGNRVVVREEGGVIPQPPTPFNQQVSGQIFKDDVNGFYLLHAYMCLPVSLKE